jgi:hypothetical protein
MTTPILSLILFCAGAVAYAIHELHAHGKLRWDNNDPYGFWGKESWLRKYEGPFETPHNTWYTKFANVKHKEAFFGSSTFLVALTDGPHLMQFIYLLCFSGAIAVHHEKDWILWLLIYRAAFGIVFTVCYSWLARK